MDINLTFLLIDLMKLTKIYAPFSKDQIDYLIDWQSNDKYHPYTCENYHAGDRSLIPSETGWHCPHCDYKQSWAYVPEQIFFGSDPTKFVDGIFVGTD